MKPEPLPFDDEDPEFDLRPEPGETTTADIVAFYQRAGTASDSVVADNEPDSLGKAAGSGEDP